MALIITPGAPDADSYVDADAFKAYCAAVGYDVTGKTDPLIEQGLRRGTRGLDGAYGQRFIGTAANTDQSLEWPRTGAVWRGSELPSDTIPRQVQNAACEAAWRELVTPGSLAPDFTPLEGVKRVRKKVGDLEKETEYRDAASTAANAMPVFAVIDGLLAGLIAPKPGNTTFGFVARA